MAMNLKVDGNVYLRYAHEILFSLNLSFITMTVILGLEEPIRSFFSRMESSINIALGIPQTDFVRGYFAILVPSAALAFILCVLLRIFSKTRLANEILRIGGGTVALFAVPAYWWLPVQRRGFPYEGVPAELMVVLLCATLYLRGKWHVPVWISIALLAGHYAFYWFFVGGHYAYPNYTGPIAPILSFCSAILWAAYVRQQIVTVPGSPHAAAFTNILSL